MRYKLRAAFSNEFFMNHSMDDFYGEYLKKTRRALHRLPELAFCEVKTRAFVLDAAAKSGCETVETDRGAVALFFDFGKPSTAVFRCELDGLPLTESTGAEYCSEHDGFMHACGHDGHMAICLALVEYFGSLTATKKNKAPRNALILFQPAEESSGGALHVAQSGILKRYGADRIFALHIWPGLPKGKLFSREGICLAKNAEVDLRIACPARHVADDGLDSLAEAARMKLSLERTTSALGSRQSPCLLKFGCLKSVCPAPSERNEVDAMVDRLQQTFQRLAGDSARNGQPVNGARNIVGGCFLLEGTLRCIDDRVFNAALKKINAAVLCGRARGFSVDSFVREGGGAVVNDTGLFEIAEKTVGLQRLSQPFLQAEDFSVYSDLCPSLYMFLGTGGDTPLHSPHFDFDENILFQGFSAFVRLFFS